MVQQDDLWWQAAAPSQQPRQPAFSSVSKSCCVLDETNRLLRQEGCASGSITVASISSSALPTRTFLFNPGADQNVACNGEGHTAVCISMMVRC
jgi:hypothetical protein